MAVAGRSPVKYFLANRKMTTGQISKNPFQFIRVHSLVGWMMLCLILTLIIYIVLEKMMGGKEVALLEEIILLGLGAVGPLIWILWKFIKHGIHFREFIGAVPKEHKWWCWNSSLGGLLHTKKLALS